MSVDLYHSEFISLYARERIRRRARTWGFLEHLFLFKKWLERCFHFLSIIILVPLGSIWLWPLRGPAAIALILGCQ